MDIPLDNPSPSDMAALIAPTDPNAFQSSNLQPLATLSDVPYHKHTGIEGDGPQINADDLTNHTVLGKISLNGAQSIGASTFPYTKVLLDTSVFSKGVTVDITNHRLVIQHSGYYLVNGLISYDAVTSNGINIAVLAINGTGKTYVQHNPGATAGRIEDVSITDIFYLNPNDYVELNGYDSSGSSLDTGVNRTYLIVTKL